MLNIFVTDDRLDEAKQLVQSTEFPKETHPDAYVAWLVSMTVYFEAIEKNAEAFRSIKFAQKIAPEDPSVKELWMDLADYDEEKDTSAYLMFKT